MGSQWLQGRHSWTEAEFSPFFLFVFLFFSRKKRKKREMHRNEKSVTSGQANSILGEQAQLDRAEFSLFFFFSFIFFFIFFFFSEKIKKKKTIKKKDAQE